MIASSDALPQTPQELERTNPRVCPSMEICPLINTTLSSTAMESTSTRSASNPSEYSNPSANSRSCPGVRMVVIHGCPLMCISRGSSTATVSSRGRASPSTTLWAATRSSMQPRARWRFMALSAVSLFDGDNFHRNFHGLSHRDDNIRPLARLRRERQDMSSCIQQPFCQ